LPQESIIGHMRSICFAMKDRSVVEVEFDPHHFNLLKVLVTYTIKPTPKLVINSEWLVGVII